MPMRSPSRRFTCALYETRFPGRRYKRRIDLDRKMVVERLGAVRSDPINHALQSLAKTDFAFVTEEPAGFVRRAGGVLDFPRPFWNVFRGQVEIEQLRDDASQLVDRNGLLVRTDVDDFARETR